MAVQVGTAYIPVKADLSGFGKEVETGTKTAMGSVKSFAKNAALAIGGAFAVQKVGQFVTGSLDAAAESRKISLQTEAVIKSMGNAAGVSAQHVGDMSSRLQKLSGVSDESIQSGANLLLTFGNIKNEVGKGNDVFDQTTRTMLDMSVALGQDTKSSAVQLGKALNDPIKGVSALQRVGVSFTESQKEQIKTLVESGDTMGAQKLILGELNNQFGGSAKAAGEALTPMQRMGIAFGDLQETIGLKLLPVIEKVTDWAMDNMPILAGIAAVVGTLLVAAFVAWAVSAASAAAATIAAAAPVIALGVAIAALIAGAIYVWTHWDEIWTWIKDKVSAVFDAVVGFVSGLPGRAKDALVAAWQAFARLWETVWLAVKSFVSDRVGDVVGFVTGLPQRAKDALLGAWSLYWDYYVGVWRAVASFVFDRLADVIGFVTGLPGKAKDALVSTWQTFAGYWSTVFTAVKDFVSARIADVVLFFTEMPGRIVAGVKLAALSLLGLGTWIVETVWAGVKTIVEGATGLLEWFGGIPGRIVTHVMHAAEKLLDLGKDIVGKIVEGIKAAPNAILDAIGGLIPDNPLPSWVPVIGGSGDGPGRAVGGRALARVQSALTAGTYVTSTYRTPARNRAAGGSPTSYHLDRNNPAVDIGGSTAALNVLAAKLRRMGGWREFLWQTAGHYDHIHVAHSGGYVTPQGIQPLRSDELLTKLQVGETVLPKDHKGASLPDPEVWGRQAARSYASELRLQMRSA